MKNIQKANVATVVCLIALLDTVIDEVSPDPIDDSVKEQLIVTALSGRADDGGDSNE